MDDIFPVTQPLETIVSQNNDHTSWLTTISEFITQHERFFEIFGPWAIAFGSLFAALTAIYAIWNTNRQNNKNRRHDKDLKNQDILLSKFEELITLLQKLEDFFMTLGYLRLQPADGTILPELPRFEHFAKLRSLGTIYFSKEIQNQISNLKKVNDKVMFDYLNISYKSFMIHKSHQIIKNALEAHNSKDFSNLRVVEVMNAVYDFHFYGVHEGKKAMKK